MVVRTKEAGIEEKIAFAIEKLARVNRILLWNVAKEEKLSPIQIQLLLYLNSHSKEFCRVSNLAEEFGLTQPTVSEAIKSLEGKGLITRKREERDGRAFILELTLAGRKTAEKTSGWSEALKRHIQGFSPQEKEGVMLFLMELIKSLREAGVIRVARMCIACSNFQRNAFPGSRSPHYCRLTSTPLANSELNMDCTGHKSKIKT